MGLPINFYKSLNALEILFAYNNNIVEFESSNNTGLNSVKCEITIASNLYEIYPDPDNVFRFNFREAFQRILNQNHFADDKLLNVDVLESSIIIEDDENSFSEASIIYKIYLENGTFESETKTLKFIKGVENIKNISDRIMVIGATDFHLLTPFEKVSDRVVNLTYWEGFPFDIGYYIDTNQTLIASISGGNFGTFDFKKFTGRFSISDGTDTIENFLTLSEGVNTITFNDAGTMKLNLKKVSGGCGKYLKWINKYGKWNYWLFNNRDEGQLETRDGKSLFNDFDDLDSNVSPFLETGKASKETIVLHSSNISSDEMFYLKYLFESPKVYLFTGIENEKMSNDSFIEVKLKGQKTIINKYKGSSFNIKCVIELPARNTMTL